MASRTAADLLEVLAQVRTRSVYAALGAGAELEPGHVARRARGPTVQLAHPLATEQQALDLLQFLEALGLRNEQGVALNRDHGAPPGVGPSCTPGLRGTLARDRGAEALSNGYESWLTSVLREQADQRAPSLWFTGLAHLVAGDRAAEMEQPEQALQAYARSEERFLGSVAEDAELAASANHYVAFARAGIARLQLEQGRLDGAPVRDPRRAGGAPGQRGASPPPGREPNQLARRVASALADAGRGEEAQALRDELRNGRARAADRAGG